MTVKKQETRQTIAAFGKKALLARIREKFTILNESTLQGPDSHASVALYGEPLTVWAQSLLLEGIDFDLSYFPLKFLGYKAVIMTLAKVAAMNALPRQIQVTVGLSQRFFVEDVDDLFTGVSIACSRYGVDLSSLELKSSYTGLCIAVTAAGECDQAGLCTWAGASDTDLICLSGNLGAAYMGLQLLEREKRVFEGKSDKDDIPRLKGYEFLLEQYLKPDYPKKLLQNLRDDAFIPGAMALVNQGLATALLHICKASDCGAKIFLNKIPIAKECFDLEKESENDETEDPTVDALISALSGGEDYRIIFTLPLSRYEKLNKEYRLDIIGHICTADKGCLLITPDGRSIDLSAMGF